MQYLSLMQNALPSNLAEIRALAAKVFEDPAAVSVNIQATFGAVTVDRDGNVRMAE